jgi:hypothetical protein
MAIRVSLSHPLHYIDQNGVHRKLYGSQDPFYFQGSYDIALAGMLRIGDLYFPNATSHYFAYYGGNVGNDQGARFTDHNISYPVPQTIRGTSLQWGALPAKVLSIGLRLFFDFEFPTSDNSRIQWSGCRVQGINSQDDTGAVSGDMSVDKDITLTFEFYSFNPDDMPWQTPQGSYSITIPAGTSEINGYHTQFFNFSWTYVKRTVTIDGVGTFTFPVVYSPWNNHNTVRAYAIHLGG